MRVMSAKKKTGTPAVKVRKAAKAVASARGVRSPAEMMAVVDRLIAMMEKRQAEDEARRAVEEKKRAVEEKKRAVEEKKRAADRAADRVAQEERWAKADQETAALKASLAKLEDLHGNYTRNTGRILEEEVIAMAQRKKRLGWMRYDEAVANYVKFRDGRKIGEFDLIVLNGRELIVLEIRRVLRADAVRKFVDKRLKSFCADCPEYASGRTVYGGMVYQTEERARGDGEADAPAPSELARREGLMLIHAVGKSGLELINADPARLRPASP